MNILSVESSCDETAVAIVRDGREVLTDCIASQVDLHRLYGGVVPEIASRKHIEKINQVIKEALLQAGCQLKDMTACLAGRIVPGSADNFIGAVIFNQNQMRVSPGSDQAYKRRLQIFIFNKIGADMSFDMMHSDQWFSAGITNCFCCTDADQEGTYKSRSICHTNSVYII